MGKQSTSRVHNPMDARRLVGWSLILSLLLCGLVWTPSLARTNSATILKTGPFTVTAGETITYEIVIGNGSLEPMTDFLIFDQLPAGVAFVEADQGGGLNDQGYVVWEVAELPSAETMTVHFTVLTDANTGESVVNSVYGVQYLDESQELGTLTVETVVQAAATPTPTATATPAPTPTSQPTSNPPGGQFEVDSGFRPNPQGYSFANWGSGGYDDATDLNSASLIRLFGASNVCQTGATANDCVLTAGARKWREEQLQGMNGGHCAGMAITGQRFFAGYDQVNNYQAGASSVFGLQPEVAVRNLIAEWFVVQSLEPADGSGDGWVVRYGDGTKPSQVLALIRQQLQSKPNELFYMGIRMEGKGGHAVNPYAIAAKGNGIYWLYVYDNNWPGAERYISFDTNQESWLYNFGATNPGETQGAWFGDAQTSTIRLRPLSAINKTGWACPFCQAAGVNASARQGGQNVEFQMFGAGKMLIVDQQDRKLGWDFASDQYVNEIKESAVDQIDNGTGIELPPIYTLPPTTSTVPYIVYFSGDTITNSVDADLMMTAPGFVVGLEYVQINPGHDLLTTIRPDGRQITFNASEEGTFAPDIYFAVDPDPNGDSYLFGIGGFSLSSFKTVTVTLDIVNGQLHFADDDGASDTYAIAMLRIRANGEVEEFTNDGVTLGGESDAAMNFGTWDGENAMPITIDGQTQNFSNEQAQASVYLPLVKK